MLRVGRRANHVADVEGYLSAVWVGCCRRTWPIAYTPCLNMAFDVIPTHYRYEPLSFPDINILFGTFGPYAWNQLSGWHVKAIETSGRSLYIFHRQLQAVQTPNMRGAERPRRSIEEGQWVSQSANNVWLTKQRKLMHNINIYCPLVILSRHFLSRSKSEIGNILLQNSTHDYVRFE